LPLQDIRCFLTVLKVQHAVRLKTEGNSKEYPPYVTPANIKLLAAEGVVK